jgi:D-alanyl-lipoteichoic acid acyltransferase DltB (MBOAT superfamily)
VSFTSVAFYAWLAAAVVAYRLSKPRWRPGVLLALSAALCATSSPTALVLLVVVTVVAYGAARRIAATTNETARTRLLASTIVVLFAPLVVLKSLGAWRGVLIPLGLSYYTFKLTSYVVETYWDAAVLRASVLDVAAYSAFGAQLVSGPIQRPTSFFDQLAEVRSGKLDDADFERAFGLILRGLLLKLVVGDRLGSFTALVAQSPEHYSRTVLAVTAFTYLPQLYADFAGYTNIALGVGLLFGIEGPPNFDAPFAAKNIQIFWRRWHMSLTTWLGDYVFTPLRMATRTWGKVGLVVSVLVNMTLIGVWHGFTLCFLVFGVVHGVFLAVSILTAKARAKRLDRIRWLTPFRVVFGIVAVQAMQAVGQIFFQAPSIGSAGTFLRALLGLTPAGAGTFASIRTDVVDPLLVCGAIAFYAGAGAPGLRALGRHVERWVPNWVRYGVTLFLIAALTLEQGGRFIYGQF